MAANSDARIRWPVGTISPVVSHADSTGPMYFSRFMIIRRQYHKTFQGQFYYPYRPDLFSVERDFPIYAAYMVMWSFLTLDWRGSPQGFRNAQTYRALAPAKRLLVRPALHRRSEDPAAQRSARLARDVEEAAVSKPSIFIASPLAGGADLLPVQGFGLARLNGMDGASWRASWRGVDALKSVLRRNSAPKDR